MLYAFSLLAAVTQCQGTIFEYEAGIRKVEESDYTEDKGKVRLVEEYLARLRKAARPEDDGFVDELAGYEYNPSEDSTGGRTCSKSDNGSSGAPSASRLRGSSSGRSSTPRKSVKERLNSPRQKSASGRSRTSGSNNQKPGSRSKKLPASSSQKPGSENHELLRLCSSNVSPTGTKRKSSAKSRSRSRDGSRPQSPPKESKSATKSRRTGPLNDVPEKVASSSDMETKHFNQRVEDLKKALKGFNLSSPATEIPKSKCAEIYKTCFKVMCATTTEKFMGSKAFQKVITSEETRSYIIATAEESLRKAYRNATESTYDKVTRWGMDHFNAARNWSIWS